MSEATLRHPLVRDYLRKLDTAARILPAAKARELREQIASHLEDAVAPDADDTEIAAVLDRLGAPAGLVADSIAAGPVTAPHVSAMARVIARFSRRTWLIAGLVVVLITAGGVAGSVSADHYLSARDLLWSGDGDWWYQQDAAHEVVSRAGLLPGSQLPQIPMTQNLTPLRCGQRQGYVISLYNPSDVTQTITADAAGPYTGWNNPGSTTEQITVSTTFEGVGNGAWGGYAKVRFAALPADIPPFQRRLVRVLWTTANEGSSTDHLVLRVRVGWFTRTESILQETWGLIVPSNTTYATCSEDPAARTGTADPAGKH